MSDLISREQAIDSWDKLSKRGRTEFDQVLMTLPSADRPTGEWIDEGDPLTIRCSKCDYRASRYNNTKCCPNCGVRIKVADDD